MSKISAIADELVTLLNAGSYTEAFTAVKAYHPVKDLADISTVQVTVIPAGIPRQELSDRAATSDRLYRPDVVMQKRIDPDDSDAVEALLDTCEEICNLVEGTILTESDVVCEEVENDPAYEIDKVDDYSEFISVISCSFRAYVEKD